LGRGGKGELVLKYGTLECTKLLKPGTHEK